MTKRLFDIVLSVVLLLLCSPLLLLIGTAVRLDSKGRAIFRQARSGRNNVPFDIWKFRTMVSDAAGLGPGITAAGDSRVTRVGAWLRRSKLDELPQLVNVLRGEMSFVGPRPEVPKYVTHYTPAQRAVLDVRPGVTGISQLEMRDEEAQLEGEENVEAAYIQRLLPAKLQLDMEYVRSRSLGTDVSILVRTAFRLFDLPHRKNRAQWSILRYRRVPIVVVQLLIVALSNYAAFLLRFDGQLQPVDASLFWQALPWLILIRGVSFVPFRLHEGLWKYTSIYDLQMLLGGILTSSLLFWIYAFSPLGPVGYPRSVFLIDAAILTLALGGMRLLRRIVTEASLPGSSGNRLIVYGAGSAGEMIVREIRQKPTFGFRPIGFIDDDARKKGMRIHGVRVLGTGQDLPAIVRRHRPSAFLIAIPDAAPEKIRATVEALEPFSLPIKILPKLQDMLDGRAKAKHIRTLAVEDLLARPPVGLDQEPVSELVRGRRIMVTGAGGSIGSELCRQILKFKPAALILFERYENSLHSIRIELDREHPKANGKIVPLIGDVTDEAGVDAALSHYRPQIVFHAAAHKHVPLMEENPCEAVKNNVRGTRILAAAAEKWGVDRLILISTDKAANPSSVMGASKHVAEQVILAQSLGSGTSFSIVRFGNVLASNGSVVPLFQDQIARGGPVTVTDPEVRRFFMMIPEAVSLVLHAAAQAHSGGTYVLDMGEQIKIVDLAKNLIRQAGLVPDVDIRIVFTGLRPGEKIAEELVSTSERLRPSPIASVSQVLRSAPGTDLLERVRALEEMAAAGRTDPVVALLRDLTSSSLAEPPAPSDQKAVEAVAVRSFEARIPCPSCAVGAITRSRARSPVERVRKRFTALKLYRCDTCSWRGWHEVVQTLGPGHVERPPAPDLAALDAVTSRLSNSGRKTSAAVRRPGFSPRDL